MSSRRSLVSVIAVVVVLACAIGTWWRVQRSGQAAAILASGVPMRPDVGGYVPAFAARLTQCEQHIAAGENATASLGELSRLYHANGFLAEAMQGYRALVHLDSNQALWHHLLATALAGYGQLDEAIPLWRRTTKLAPDYAAAPLRLAEILHKTNQLEEAAEVYADLLHRDPENPYALIGLARLDIAAGRWTLARERLERARAHPARLPAGDLLAKVYERLGEPALALAERRRPGVGETDFCDVPDPWVTNLTNECYDATQLVIASAVSAANRDVATTRRQLERAVKIDPDNAYAQRKYGVFLADHDELSRARGHLERATVLGPTESDNWAKLIWLLNKVGDQPAADRALAAGLARCPNSPALHLERGRRFKAAGQFTEALAALDVARQLRPQEVDAYVEAADIYFRMSRVDDAITQLRAALTAVPEHPVALYLLARNEIDRGNESAATDLVRRARVQVKIRSADLAALEESFRQRFGRRP